MKSDFYQNILIEPPVIFGFQLRDFSAYHALVLSHFDSPFMTEGADVTGGDLLFALFVMRSSFNEGLDEWYKFNRSYFRKLYMQLKMAFKPSATEDAIDDVYAHMDGYTHAPEIWHSDHSSQSAVPWPFRIASTIWFATNCKQAEAWDMGIGRATCYQACICEDNGLNVKTDFEALHEEWITHPVQSKKCKTFKEFMEWKNGND